MSERLQSKGFETYLPTVTVKESCDTFSTQPLFPGYLFVQVNPDVDELSQIRWIPGVKQIVAFGGRPATTADKTIRQIRKYLTAIENAGEVQTSSSHPTDSELFSNLEEIFECKP